MKRFLAAVAREVDAIYYQILRVQDVWSLDRATGEDLDRRVADLQPLGLVRLSYRRATGSIVFSRRVAGVSTIIIPAGTVALTDSGIAYRTTREVEITATSAEQIAGHGVGRDSLPAPAVAVSPGVLGNVVVGAIRRLQGSITGVDEVRNTTAFVNGRDRENDDQLRARAKAYIASLARCGYLALEYAAIGITDGTKEVVYSRAIQNPLRRGDVTLWIDDGNGTAETTAAITGEVLTQGLLGPPADTAVGGEQFLSLNSPPVRLESPYVISVNGTPLVNDVSVFLSPTDGVVRLASALVNGDSVEADYTRYTGLIPAVQTVINGVRGNAALPGWGAFGVRIRVRAPRILAPSFSGTLFVGEGTDRTTAITNAQNATIRLINSGGIGDDAVIAQIIDAVMEVPGIKDFVCDQNENIAALDDELIRITTANVDYD